MQYTRTNIYLLEDDKKKLKIIAEDEGKKFSELVRILIREYINEQSK